ncbi:hypothetical protein C7E17_26770 [Stenotrophomonas maltophilia]|nr:hypothetical protein C7E17_26770 [Stenotrophomonas maltophilia]
MRLAQRTTAVAGAATSISAVVGKVPVQDIAGGHRHQQRWHDCRPANRSLPMGCALRSGPRR